MIKTLEGQLQEVEEVSKTYHCNNYFKGSRCDTCLAQACMMKMKIHKLATKTINIVNDNVSNTTCFSIYSSKFFHSFQKSFLRNWFQKMIFAS